MNPIPVEITRKTGLEAELPRVFTSDHTLLNNRDAADQHPISAITGLRQALAENKGPQGKSAYEIALEHGFVGTEDEWLESLNGTDGESSAPPDWNQNDPTQPDYVKNRTHFSEPSEAELLPLTEATPMDMDEDGITDMFVVMSTVELIDGENYRVNWNGTDYLTKCYFIPNNAPAIGDVFLATDGAIGTEPTGEPFVITTMPTEEGGDPILAIMPLDGSEALTLSITHIKENIQKIDPKFIPWEAAWQGSPLRIILDENLESGIPSLPFDTAWEMSAAQIKSLTSFVFSTSLGGVVDYPNSSVELSVVSVFTQEAFLPDGTHGRIIRFMVSDPTKILGTDGRMDGYREYEWRNVNGTSSNVDYVPIKTYEIILDNYNGKRYKIDVNNDGQLEVTPIS